MLFVVCSRPAIDIGQSGLIGAGSSPQTFNFNRTITPMTYLRPGTFIYLVAALVLVAAGI